MSKKYYYGTPDQEYYDETDHENAAQCIADTNYYEESNDYLIMVEMTNSRKSGHVFLHLPERVCRRWRSLLWRVVRRLQTKKR